MADPDITLTAEGIVSPGVWTDITSRWKSDTELTVDWGRQEEGLQAGLADGEASKMSCTLRNHDNAFTPRSTAAAAYPGWQPKIRLRVTETVAGVDYDLHTGYLQDPEVRPARPGKHETVTISTVDILGRLEEAPPLRGTLAEHIAHTGAGTLAEWYPLDDPTAPHMSQMSGAVAGPVTEWTRGYEGTVAVADLQALADTDGPPGDDGRYLTFSPAVDPPMTMVAYRNLGCVDMSVPLAVGQVMATSVWYRAEYSDQGIFAPTAWMTGWLAYDGADYAPQIWIADDAASARIGVLVYADGVWTELWTDQPREIGVWRLVTARLDTATGQIDLWIGARRAASTSIAPPSDGPWEVYGCNFGDSLTGALAHAQLYIGDSDTFTRADHVAQHRYGYAGGHRQTVADRITTVLGYAGVDAGLVDMPAAAATPMQPARLSDAGVVATVQAAATTGQDALWVTGSGQVTLVPRAERYGQAVQLQIPWGWLAADSIRYRTDQAINDVRVGRAGGGHVRRRDYSDQLARGVVPLAGIDLDTAVDVDPANLASWLARTYGQTRTRITGARINMMSRTPAERQQLLELRPGHRIQLTGVPDGQPEDITDLIVHGGQHIIGPGRRRLLELRLGPLLGPALGEAPVCPVVGDLVGPAVVAY